MKKLEKITRKSWFFALLIGLQFIMIPFSAKNFSFEKIGGIIEITLSNSIQVKIVEYYIYFQILAIVMLILLFALKNKIGKIFNLYVTLSYVGFAIIQNIAITENYGLSVITVNIFMILFVAYVWLKEFLNPQNDYSFSNLNWRNFWLIVLALIAFWFPLERDTFAFSLSLSHFLYSGSSLAFCMMTPVFLTIITLNIPKINIVTYRVTAVIGVIIGFYNMMNFRNPNTVNLALIHLPLLIISIYAMIKSYLLKEQTTSNN